MDNSIGGCDICAADSFTVDGDETLDFKKKIVKIQNSKQTLQFSVKTYIIIEFLHININSKF